LIVNNTGLIILAAGSSKRLGKPKQLLAYEGSTLLRHSIKAGLDSEATNIVVVLGAHAEQIKKEIEAEKVETVVNTEWEEGIASSIRIGLQTLINSNSSITGVVVMLCDQPYVTAALINNLIECHQLDGKPVIASVYGEVTGVPAYFNAKMFSKLFELKGDMGARSVIQKHFNEVATVDFPKGSVDIDTEADYKKMMEVNQQ